MRRLWPVGICAAVLALGGCGSSDSDTASAPSSTTQTAPSAPQPSHQSTAGQTKGKQPEGSAAKGKGKTAGSSPHSAHTVKIPPISSAPVAGSRAPAPGVKTVRGGDDSVQTYGTEADEAARTEAAIALQAYLNARTEEDWGRVCSYLGQRPKEQLEKFDESPKGQGLSGCTATMEALGEGAPQAQLQEEATITEVLSLRGEGDVSGDPSYLIFTGPPGSTLYSMPMYLEAGWKVGLALPSELPV